MQAWAGRTVPSGWQGQWPPTAPPGFNGPPPPPQGVDPGAWYGGQWQVNPMFPAGASAPAQPWAPHPSWGVAAAPAQNHNPYKRVPNRGDAAYWATKLLDNPLGLENMIPKEQLEKEQQGAEPQTPWLWVPKELSKSDERHDHPPNPRDGHGVRDTQDSRRSSREMAQQPASASSASNAQYMQQQQQRHHHHSGSQASQAQQQPAQQPVQPHRSQTQPPYSSSNNNQPNGRRQQTEPTPRAPPSSAPATVSTYSEYYQQQQRQQQTQTQRHSPRPQEDPTPTPTPQPPQPPRTPTHTVSASSQARSQENEKSTAFSAHQELKPTFSANIVRTPNHYSVSSASAAANGTPTRTGSVRKPSRDDYTSNKEERTSFSPRRDTGRSHSRYRDRDDSSDDDSPPPRSHVRGPIYAPPTPTPNQTRSRSTATSPTRSNTVPTRESSIASLATSMSSFSVDTAPTSASSTTYLSTFSDEPGILSPLLVGGPTPSKSSPRGSNKSSPRERDVNRSSPREISRSQTYPLLSSSAMIPEERSTPPLSRTPSQKTPRRSPGTHKKSPAALGRSQTHPNLDFRDEPPVIPPMPSPSFMGRSPSPTRSSSRNPLPVPPMPSVYSVSSASASASAMSQEQQRRRKESQYEHNTSSAQHHSTSSPSRATQSSSGGYQSQSQPQRKVRRGFWNRRGDHLVIIPHSSSHSPSSPSSIAYGKKYIVYAPRARANPEELAQYPSPTDGWMDHRGRTIRYDPSVPELPDSLPLHGEPPLKPYEQFVEYTYV